MADHAVHNRLDARIEMNVTEYVRLDYSAQPPLSSLSVFSGLRGLPGHLGADRFHLFTGASSTFAALRCGIDQLLQVGGKLRSKVRPDFAENRLNLGENSDLLAIGVGEKIQADGSAIHQRRSHVPISDHHAHVAAMFAEDRGAKVRYGFRVEIAKIPFAGFAHRLFTTQFVQFQNQTSFILYRHNTSLSNLN